MYNDSDLIDVVELLFLLLAVAVAFGGHLLVRRLPAQTALVLNGAALVGLVALIFAGGAVNEGWGWLVVALIAASFVHRLWRWRTVRA